jgi:hypothetical protein
MQTISSKSKQRVVQLMNPGPQYERRAAPARLTVRALMHQKRFLALREKFAFAIIEGEHLVCLANLTRLGFDYFG